MTDKANLEPQRSEEERREANRPDLGGPSWPESMHQREQDFLECVRVTLKSAMERSVIPDIWSVSNDERNLFFKGLHRIHAERFRFVGLRDLTRPQAEEAYTDEELRNAWMFVEQTLDEVRRLASQREYDEAMRQGLVPTPGSVEPALYQRYALAATELSPAPVMEYVKLWTKIQEDWKSREQVVSPSTNGSNATPGTMPLLPLRARDEDWFKLFDWFHRQPRETVSTLEDLAQLCDKAPDTVRQKHALYQAGRR